MKKVTITLMSIFLFLNYSNAQKFDNYSDLWKEVQKFEVKSLPKSALEVVETIYKKAKTEENSPQLIKTLLYKSKFALTLDENAQLKVVSQLKTEIENVKTPTKNVVESVLANIYWQYFKQNRWKFYNRTKTSKKVDSVDFRAWDLKTLFAEIHTHFQNSLQNGIILQQTNLDEFNDLLLLQKDSKKYRPTLFDFIAHNALEFYKTPESSITKPANKFEISAKDFDQFFITNDSYLDEKDKQSLQLNALKIYQDLIAFHNKTKNENAFVSVELERLNFIKQHLNIEGKDAIHFQKLTTLKKEFKNQEASTLIDFEIATIHFQKGNLYNSETNKDVQFVKVKALDICDLAIKSFPESLGAKQCKSLKTSILLPSLNLLTEKYIPTNKHSKFLAKYKNINNLFTNVYIISGKEISAFNKIYNDSAKIAFINKLTQVEALQNTLKNEKDYQQHSTEIIIPPLKNSNYLIVSRPQKELNKESVFATATVQSTNISLVQKSTNEQHVFQVIDRNTGKPFTNAKVSVKNYNTGRYNKTISRKLTTNKFGELSFKTRSYHRNVVISVENENEKALFGDYYFNEHRDPRTNKTKEPITIKPFIFTDRSIYRPGQTIHFKGILLKKQGDKSEVFTHKFVEVSLENPNGEEVKQLNLKLNEFGSVSGTFILPNNGLNGQYTIHIDKNSAYDSKFYDNTDLNFDYLEHSISVEEYKRPKFEAEFKPVTDSFKLNDSVTVKGNALAFAGSNISNGKVTYRVHRKVVYPLWFYWYRPSFNSSEAMEITHGETTTDNEGNFEITFKAIPDKSADKTNKPIFTYEIEADITDINGETRSTTTIVKVGYHTLDISTSINNNIDLNNKDHKINLTTNNLNGEFVPTKGTLKVYKLQAPQNVLRERPWNVPDYQNLSKDEYQELFPHEPYTNNENNVVNWKKNTIVFETDFNTENSKKISLKRIKNWKVGNYIIEVEARDKYNQLVEDKARFSVFNSKKPTVSDNQIFEISTNKNLYKVKDKVELKIGSSANEVYVTIAIEKQHKIVSQQVLKLNNEVKTIEIPVTQEDLDGFAIKYSFSAFNSFKSGVKNIVVPKQLNDISFETQTFRDKLQPGQEETWSFKIKGDNKDKISAEILASMYDASLDLFKSHSWGFNPIQQASYYSYNNWNSHNSYGNTNFRVYNLPRRHYQNTTQQFDKLNWFGFSLGNNRIMIRGTVRKSNEINAVVEAEDKIVEDASFMYIDENDSLNEVVVTRIEKTENKTEPEKVDLSNLKARKNFKETAFFFPHLKTDDEGNVSFNFTMPEALTRWKLQLLAHTKKLATTTKTLTTVTQKELMVLPNPPRFLREGDVLQFSSKISNLSDKALNGVAQLVLTDAISGKEITRELLHTVTSTPLTNQQNFFVDKKGNTNVNWTLNIPDNVQAVQYKIVAKAGEFSDGEQNILPVLSNRMLVTETLPMWVRSNQTKTFTLDKLKNVISTPLKDQTLKHHKLTLEITSNPAWYAVQSLPYLMEYPYECAEQTFSRYYANTLASHIINSNPRIQEVFNLWQRSDALVSNLEKNEELKSIIIQETPWLRDAQSETEQKKRIGLLFDLNKMKNEQEIAINKLKELQFSNGGFPWFKGSRYPNRYITQHIASSYGHLKKLNVVLNDYEESHKIIAKAVKFLDDEILDDYKNLLKEAKKIREKEKTKAKGIKAEKEYLGKNHLGHTQLHYLYMRSFYSTIEIPLKVQKAVDYYTNQSATYWTDYNLYSKGMIALIQHRNNNSKITSEILKSLKENSISSEELGMYWKENTPSWFWYQSPIETQALLIEVFSEIENDIKTIDELKVWLLKNKQTNRWKTTKATTEAVYALLLQGGDWLSVNESIDVTLGTQKIEPSKLENVKIEAGTGYFKTSWNGTEISSGMGDVTISKKDEGVAWGGFYWQYFEDLDKITSAETPLKLSKKIFIKQNTDTGKELTEIIETSNLKIGDLITVRVELKVDRPMEFVHMKDMHASGLEPINVLSSYKWQDGLGYYESTKDASTNFFMERLPKGVYVFEYDLRINNAGNFSNGITTIQSMYAPEFSSHTEGVRIEIED